MSPTFWGLSDIGWIALTAVGTVGAVVVAIALGLGVQRLIFGPNLMVSLLPGLPDFCPVETAFTVTKPATIAPNEAGQDVVTPPMVGRFKDSEQYYCRFRVENRGNWRTASAEDVQVLLSRLWWLDSPQGLVEVQPFLPVQLSWADIVGGSILRPELEVVLPLIQPDVFRYCNLCFVDAKAPDVLEFSAKPIPNPI